MKNLTCEVASKRIVIDLDKLNIKKIKRLIVAIDEVKQKHLPQTKYPVHENETTEKWYERVMTDILDNMKKKDDETEEAHAIRLADIDMEDHIITIGFDLLREIIKIFDLAVEITDEDVENASWSSTRNFLFDLLSEAELGAASMFRPPLTAKQITEQPVR